MPPYLKNQSYCCLHNITVQKLSEEQARGNTLLQQHQKWLGHGGLNGEEAHMQKGI